MSFQYYALLLHAIYFFINKCSVSFFTEQCKSLPGGASGRRQEVWNRLYTHSAMHIFCQKIQPPIWPVKREESAVKCKITKWMRWINEIGFTKMMIQPPTTRSLWACPESVRLMSLVPKACLIHCRQLLMQVLAHTWPNAQFLQVYQALITKS